MGNQTLGWFPFIIKRMIVILCRASAVYSGRIDAELSLGDICLLVKDTESGGDGSVILHDMCEGMSPRNWMPAGTDMIVSPGMIVFEHFKREEKLEVFVEKIYEEHCYPSSLKTKLAKLGAEKEFSDLLAHHLHLVNKELSLIKREWRSGAGPLDLLCIDTKGNPIAIEVKRRHIDPNAVWQMRRYLHALESDPEWEGKTARGIMVAPSLQKSAKAMIDQFHDIEFCRVKYEDMDNTILLDLNKSS